MTETQIKLDLGRVDKYVKDVAIMTLYSRGSTSLLKYFLSVSGASSGSILHSSVPTHPTNQPTRSLR